MSALSLKSALPRVVVAVGSGAVAALASSPAGGATSALIGVAVAGGLFVALGWLVLWPMDAQLTKAHPDEDLSPALHEALVVALAVAGLGSIVALLLDGGTSAGSWPAGVAVVGVFTAWAPCT